MPPNEILTNSTSTESRLGMQFRGGEFQEQTQKINSMKTVVAALHRRTDGMGTRPFIAEDVQPVVEVAPLGNDRETSNWEQISMVPYQTWEGYVTSVIPEERRFTADLHDKAGIASSYSAEISITEISPEDTDLVSEGAVFYWTFGKVNASKGNSFNFDQIRFRRLPNWTKIRLDASIRKAEELYDFFQDAE